MQATPITQVAKEQPEVYLWITKYDTGAIFTFGNYPTEQDARKVPPVATGAKTALVKLDIREVKFS